VEVACRRSIDRVRSIGFDRSIDPIDRV
jgi:hypothetical protein